MKYLILFAATFFIFNCGFTQDSEPRFTFKVYNTVSWNRQSVSSIDTATFTINTTTQNHFRFLHASPALMIRNEKGRWHEIEISDFDMKLVEISSQSLDTNLVVTNGPSEKYLNTNIALRYEYIYPLFNTQDRKVTTAVGLGGGLFFQTQYTAPGITTEFPLRETLAGLSTCIVPRIMFKAGKRLLLDLNMPITLLRLSSGRLVEDNPALPLDQRTWNNFNFDMFGPGGSVRLGAGWRF